MPATTAQFLSLSPPRKWSVKKNKKGKRAALERDGAKNNHGSLLDKLQSRRGGGGNSERCHEKRRSSSMSPQPLLSSTKSSIPSSPDMTLLSGDTALLSVSFSSDSDDDKKSDADLAVDTAANNDNISEDSANAVDPPPDDMFTEKIESPNNNVDDKISAALDVFLTKCQNNQTENRSNKLEWAFLVDAMKEKSRQDPWLGKVLDGNIKNEEEKERSSTCNQNEEREEGQSMLDLDCAGKSITSELSASTTDWVDFPPQLFRSNTPRHQKTISGDYDSIIETMMPWDDADDQVNNDDDARKCLFGDDDNDLDCYGFVIGSVDEETIRLRQENELLRNKLEEMSTAAIERQDAPDVSKIEILQNEIDELKEELSLAKERLEVASETNIAINEAHDRKAEECEDLQREVNRLTELVQEQEKNRLENATETNKALNEAHDQKHKECEELKSDIDKFADSFATQHDNLQQLERRVSKLASENEELKASNRSLAKRLNNSCRQTNNERSK